MAGAVSRETGQVKVKQEEQEESRCPQEKASGIEEGKQDDEEKEEKREKQE